MNAFASLLSGSAEYGELLSSVKRGALPVGALGLSLTAKAHIIFSLCSDLGKKALILTSDEASASRISADLCAMGLDARLYPVADRAFRSSESRSGEYEKKRLGVLGSLCFGSCDAVAASVEAAMQLTVPKKTLLEKTVTLRMSASVERETLLDAFIAAGYTRCESVEGRGQFAVRGSIVDFFPPDSTNPVRAEFWGDEIDSLGYFDALSQRRGENIDSVTIMPATEAITGSCSEFAQRLVSFAQGIRSKKSAQAKQDILADAAQLENGVRLASYDKYLPLCYEKCDSLLDYCSDFLVFAAESSNIKEKAESSFRLLSQDIKQLFEDNVLCKGLDEFSIKWSDVVRFYEKSGVIYLDNFARGSFDTPVKELISMNVRQSSPWEGSLTVLRDDLSGESAKGVTTVILACTKKAAEGLCEELIDEGFKANFMPRIPPKFIKGQINVLPGSLSFGIEYPLDKIKIITRGSYASGGRRAPQTKSKFSDVSKSLHSIEELQRGDYVVHSLHGVGVFEGVVDMTITGVRKDYIKIKYAGTDVLYVPVTQLDLVSKYIGPVEDSGRRVKINKLGSSEWSRTKARVRTAVKDMAQELLQLYAKRRQTKGYAFSPDIDMQSDFERRFEFDETDDQLRCVYEIKQDMEKPYPMDRLLCGDVGFGKTEVALRAAFKCVADSKQCAVLVPTTILALQHYRTIMRRLEGFPVRVDMLSRFRSASQQQATVKGLASGRVDIVVGTHRLISKDVKFKDLGLVIIDEEQRFGVAQKEKLKAAHPGVDILTLSATPIPRTLNMAMTGIRDMSVIEQSPLDRSPVQTYVLEHDMGILAGAIEKELRRGGQVYYLYNTIESIDSRAEEIRRLVPDARVGTAHGKMAEEQLSEVWRQLLEGEINVLVCTTIIETGVDVPNVNTLIIENADRMGLAQLHQIRGRVGRSARRAFAYFTFRRGKELSETAQRRLTAIREYTQFGSGFKIAMKDLEIRGAGNILGAKQHGHLEAVGYDMYLQLLSQAVSEQESDESAAEPEKECLVDIRINAHIPEKYISAMPHRLSMYRKIAAVRDEESASDVLDELIDRFGEPPESVKGLITVALIRNKAKQHKIYEIKQTNDSILLYCESISAQEVAALSKALRSRVLVNASKKPYISVRLSKKESPLDTLTLVMKLLG